MSLVGKPRKMIMSAENTVRANGQIEFAAANGVAVWWESEAAKVNRVADDAKIEEWTVAAGMDWRIQRANVRYNTGVEGAPQGVIEDKVVLLRSDNKKPLSIVSTGFKIVQPKTTLEFFRDLVEEAGFKMKTAGTLHGGKKFWAQAEVGADTITKGTFNRGSLLLATAADGTMQTTAKGVNTEVVCANTFGFALSERGGSMVKVSHRTLFQADKVKRQLGVAVDQYQKFIHQARELAHMDMSPEQARVFTFELLGGDLEDSPDQQVKVFQSQNLRKILGLFNGDGIGSTMPGRANTAWGMVNAVTEFIDHHQRSASPDHRFNSSQFGAGDGMKSAAWQKALAMMTA
jgi:phage/plasmid-like protein (TIGR03299 family)